MKLLNCYIENFGKLHGYRHTFEDGLNVILEDNGWGKTTFAAFIKAMFYGMDYTTKKSITENERRRFMPWQGGNYGGYIVFEIKGKIYRIERFFGLKDKEDVYHLYDETTGTISSDFGERPGEEIFGIDAFAYERSTFMPQNTKDLVINDSLTAKLSNVSEGNGDVESFQKAVNQIDSRMKYYRKTGERGRIAELEAQIADITRELSQFSNRTESFENLKNKKAELESKRIELFNELKNIREELKKSSEYDGLKARKSHYDMLVKNHLEAKSRLDSAKLFFEKPELMKEIDKRKDDYENLSEWDVKYRDESENLKELEYRKHGLTTQYAAQKKAPVASFILMLLGIVAAGCGVFLWVMDGNIYIPVACVAIGVLMFLVGLFTWIIGSGKAKREYTVQIGEVDEQIDCSRIALREYTVKREQAKKSLENYVNAFQVEQPENILKSLMEIESKIREYDKFSEMNTEAMKELSTFEEENEMEKIRGLAVPHYSMGELQKKEVSVNNALMSIMEEKNSIVRRMDAIANEDEDENDLIQSKERLGEELKESIHKFEILSMTKELLSTANDQFKTKYIQKMKDAFQKYAGMLNGMDLENVSVDIDLNVTIEDYGVKRNLEHYSTGVHDMLSLCTRFALVTAMFPEEQPFIILDDPFVNLDGARMKNGMEFLQKLADKNQILYFTCHESRA